MKARYRAMFFVGVSACALAACTHTAPGSAADQRDVALSPAANPSAFWNSATVYFLLTDRFANGDSSNDHALGRAQDGAVLRSYQGGDLKGALRKVEEGYFDSLGVNVIWLTPFVEQIHGSVDEGQGKTYGYHGYWTRDWTAVEPALGTKEDLHALVDAAHRHGIRVLMDAVINHTGPATALDPAWPADWVRAGPNCTYRDYATTVNCNLVATLPDVLTERDEPVELPTALVEKWRQEGRLDQERAGLDAFFQRTGYPRAPRYYLIKWLTDWVREFGFDGYRMDTAKHFGETVSAELKKEAVRAFADWKLAHAAQVLDDLPFYMVGEVYGWDPSQGRTYNYGDRSVDFFAHGYDGLINFSFKRDIAGSVDSIFTQYSSALHGFTLRRVSFLNYISSHDDGAPYDLDRKDPFGAGTRLLLAPGGAQIYYGDELARPLRVAGAQGDANLRSFMNWQDLARDSTRRILEHWRKLGQFRRAHPAVGAGVHLRLRTVPYIFSRILESGTREDRVLVATGLGPGPKTIAVYGVFSDGTSLLDSYSGDTGTVRQGSVSLSTARDIVLLGENPNQERNDDVVVNVTNNYALPMDVFAIASGSTFRMGTVNPGIGSRFTLHKNLFATNHQVTFLAQATGFGPRATTDRVYVTPGSTVDFVIATNLVGSLATVRP